MNLLNQYLIDKLNERSVAGNLRTLKTNRAAVDFFSNDYLGIATNRLLVGGDSWQSGATGSRLLSGNHIITEQTEQYIAAFHHAEAALLFNSGYDANLGLLSCIANRHTTILYDELCHASIIDGIRLSQCNRKYRFAHNNLPDLAAQIAKYCNAGPVIVATESVFSMDGDLAPLAAMAELCQTTGAQLIVDEAHATGIFGLHGRGLVCALGLEDRVFARVHTYGKALGCHGAAVVGSALLVQYLINFARSFIYTTALPGHSVATIARAYAYLSSPGFTNQPLHDLIDYFRNQITHHNLQGWTDSRSPIQALIVADNERCKQLAACLQNHGLQVNPILHPTVPQGMERLRICLHTYNTTQQIDLLMRVIAGKG
jgi:8-amino-7-oxononanoate synthase